MRVIVERTVCRIESKNDRHLGKEELSLSDLGSEHGYVLLGEPGMGKTTEFNKEAHRIHANPTISAREFISRNLENHPEWREGPLFIDGLDEVRIGSRDPRVALDKIIERLEALGNPQFRLSCRSINWLEDGDRKQLATLSDSKDIPVLQLNPLKYDDIRKIISDREANAFIQQAHEHNMEAFLENPQLLTVLLKSVENGGWSDSPTKTFENACRELIREQNREHRDARLSEILPSFEAVLSAAGQLSAYMLIANKAGWSVDETEDSEVLSLRDVETQDALALRTALNSALFEGSLSCRVPIHRLLAEFLSGRYLDEKIRDGLSVRRAFALLMGHDGIPFPDLRGLAAWLAAFNPRARTTLIHADPVAVAFNGDASNFGYEERQKLLENLERKNDFTYTWPSAAALGTLAGNQGRSLIWELTDSPIRSNSRKTLVYQLLRGVYQMHHSASMNEQALPDQQLKNEYDKLLPIIYDHSWNGSVRRQALHVLNRMLMDTPGRGEILRRILEDLTENELLDEKPSLREMVLEFLYPGELQPSKVWDYLPNGSIEDYLPAYPNFWMDLVTRSNEEQIRGLINSLCGQSSEVIPKLARYNLADIVLELLARGLELSGDKLELPELYRWFELIELDDLSSDLIPAESSVDFIGQHDREASEKIHNWLDQRKDKQYALIEHDLITQKSKIVNDNTIGLKFVGTNTPAGFRSWCIARAAELWDTYPMVAKRLAEWSVLIREGWGDPLSDNKVEQAVSGISSLCKWNRGRLRDKNQRERKEAERRERRAERQAALQERRRIELEPVRQQKIELAKGHCSPVLLDRLARIYFSGSIFQDNHPRTSLESYMNGDQSLVQATLEGFRSLLNRDDLPDLEQIAKLHENNQRSYFALPFLAGMQEMEYETGMILSHLNDQEIRRFLGFYLVTDIPRLHNWTGNNNANSNCPKTWFEQALKRYPEAVTDSLVSIHNACVRAKLLPNEYLYKMAYDREYLRVAQLAVNRMFTVFPTRCSGYQLDSLRVVLWSVILAGSMSTEDFRKVVLKRLNRENMDTGQKAYWLCAGLSVARDHCLPLLVDFLSAGEEPRIRHIFDFLITSGSREFIFRDMSDWQPEELSSLIQALGKRGQSLAFQEGPYVLGNGMRNNLSSLTPWIGELGRRSDDDAAEALALLVDDPDLTTWKQEIRQAREAQAWNSRAAKRLDFSIEQIQETLQNGPPASAADLAALTTDVLEKLANRIRNGPTSDWRQYWHRDQKTRKPIEPQHENDCRNALLSDLKAVLRQHDIDAQPEGMYADETRADIRVSYGSDLSVPIEIKKNSHREIWHGISEQLVPKYTRDPNSDGYGIYLVFWFGTKYMKVIAPEGCIPNEPKELKNLLKKQLDSPLREKIHIVVIDVDLKERYADGE